MTFKGFRPVVAAAVLIAVFGALVGGWRLFRRQTVDQPLFHLDRAVKQVQGVEVSKEGGTTVVRVSLGDVPDLQSAYLAIEERAKDVLKDRPFKVEIVDDRTPALKESYRRASFVLEEGIATGRYSEMASEFDDVARGLGLDRYRLSIDEGHVYAQMHSGGHSLYGVLERAGREGVGG